MKRFVAGADRAQSTLLPESLDDWVDESNPVRVIDAFVDALNVAELGFEGVEPAATGRPSYHPSSLLKLYIYGYLNRVQSSRRLEREAGRNVEVMRLLGRLTGPQDGCGLPQGQRWRHQEGLCAFRRAVPAASADDAQGRVRLRCRRNRKNIARKPREASLHCNRGRLRTLLSRFRTTKTQCCRSRRTAIHFSPS